MLSEQRNRVRFATTGRKLTNELNTTSVHYNIKSLNAVYKLDNYAGSVLTAQSNMFCKYLQFLHLVLKRVK